MKIKQKKFKYYGFLLIFMSNFCISLPSDFVYLKDIDPSIVQDIRYAGDHNFLGRPVQGYQHAECVLTKAAAVALQRIQQQLKKSSLSLKVYDCYRPQRAVDDFVAWSKVPSEQQMKAEFFPRVDKTDFFKLGYVDKQSGHSRGSTVDLTIVPIPYPKEESYHKGQVLVSCFAPYGQRFRDASIDMGTGYDCMDVLSHPSNTDVSKVARKNRQFLRYLMLVNGFRPLATEWWHFTLQKEPYPKTYFNFTF